MHKLNRLNVKYFDANNLPKELDDLRDTSRLINTIYTAKCKHYNVHNLLIEIQ